MDADDRDVDWMLKKEKQFVVPQYQRPYSWDFKEWKDLWQDIQELHNSGRPNHFIGSIVTVQRRGMVAAHTLPHFLLIDGQQRFTTILILLAAIRDSLNEACSRAADEIQRYLFNDGYDGLDHLKLLPTEEDRAAFIDIVEGRGSERDDRLSRAFRFFRRHLLLEKSPPLERLKTLVTEKLVLVSIGLGEEDNAHLIFETLNWRGMELDEADLIRNYFFMRADIDQVEPYAKRWKGIEQKFDRDSETLTAFMRHFLMKDGSSIKVADVYYRLKKIGDGKTASEILSYLDEIVKFADYYEKLLFPEREENSAVSAAIRRWNRLDMKASYPFLLNVFDDFSTGQIAAAQFIDVLQLLESFIIRRLFCDMPTNRLSKIFPGLYTQAEKFSGASKFVDKIKDVLRGKDFPSDNEFKKNFVTHSLYQKGSNDKARFILESLEKSFGHKEGSGDENIEIEHVMPKEPSKEWKFMLGERWKEIHDTWLNTIGNLTLSGYNENLHNSEFAVKQSYFRDSTLQLNRWFRDLKVWNDQEIAERATELSEIAVRIWPSCGSEDTSVVLSESDVVKRKPQHLKIYDEVMPVTSWREVVEKTMETLISLVSDDEMQEIMDAMPKFIGTDPSKFTNASKLSNGLYVEINLTGPKAFSNCRKATQIAGLLLRDWTVELRPEKKVVPSEESPVTV